MPRHSGLNRQRQTIQEVGMRKLLLSTLLLMSICGVSYAQGSYDIKEMTPQVKAALEARKSRFGELKALKAQGFVGETNRGYVEVLGGGAYVMGLVADENRDRKFIYQTIVEQHGLGVNELSTVESVFAGVQRDKASPGDKIQDPAGNWKAK
jgi:uncharacterized protein YdbL (DUF1318 family)